MLQLFAQHDDGACSTLPISIFYTLRVGSAIYDAPMNFLFITNLSKKIIFNTIKRICRLINIMFNPNDRQPLMTRRQPINQPRTLNDPTHHF